MSWNPRAADRADVVLVAAAFADAVAHGDLARAERLVAVATEVAGGGWALLSRPRHDVRGRRLCQVITRAGSPCPYAARPGQDVCGMHAKLIREEA